MGGKKKNFEENDKKTSARDRKEKQKAEASAKQKAQAEDAYWAAAGDGAKSKSQKKKEEAEARAADAAKKKAEAKRLAEAEEKSMESVGKKPQNSGKMTAFERSKLKEKDAKAQQQAAEERAMASKRQVSEQDFARQMRLDEANSNRNEDEVSASGLDQAVKALADPSASAAGDNHPEKRVKAAFNAYCEANLADLKMEKPGLRANQYKDMLWKQFQKSPENPMNRLPGP